MELDSNANGSVPVRPKRIQATAGPASMPAVPRAAEPGPDEIHAYMVARTHEVLVSRAIAQLLVILAGAASYSVAKFSFDAVTTYMWYGPILALVVCQLIALSIIRHAATTMRLEHILLANSVFACAVAAWVGVVAGRTAGSDFLILGIAMLSAALIPWRPGMQASLAAFAALAIVANAWGVSGSVFGSLGFPTLVPVGVLLCGSVYASRVLQTSRLESARSELLRARAEAETSELNAMLERRVRERTAELQAANEELEAFSYSVSHDLRAPLRAMDGLSEVLIEEYSHLLDESARDYLRRIRGEAARLGRLVDDLLQLSRVTRSVMKRRQVDVSAVAKAAADRLRATSAQRDVVFSIEPGIREDCDETLVRVLLENLLHNAFKFTGKVATAQIEFGLETQGRERVYFVRDNGVGFDMAHSGKIFGAFERLHRQDEFDGTGIGLATANRIVHRHGGTITADARPGDGATFRFTLRPSGEADS